MNGHAKMTKFKAKDEENKEIRNKTETQGFENILKSLKIQND